MATWQHLRSSTANKRPTTSLADGRIAINTNTASPGLFFKDSAGTGIVKVGPVHVGTTAPNSVPASGGSSGNYLGEQWLDTSVSPAQMKVWNGSTWVGIVADELPVSKLQDGAPRQLIQTDAAGTGVEWTSNVDVPGTLDVTGATTLDSTLSVASAATFSSTAAYPLGTAGAPTITFTGDTNTGVYSPGADQVSVATGGTERLRIDAAGQIEANGLGSAAAPAYSWIGDPNTGIYSPGADQVAISTNGTARLRVGSDGTILAGTASAFGQGGLTISPAYSQGSATLAFNRANTTNTSIPAYFQNNDANVGWLAYSNNTVGIIGASGTSVVFGTNSAEVARFDSSGRLGLGVSDPVEKLVVAGATANIGIYNTTAGSTASPSYSRLNFYGYLQTTLWNVASISAGNSASNTYGGILQFATNTVGGTHTTALTIDSSQRVGIGTTGPSSELEVSNGVITAGKVSDVLIGRYSNAFPSSGAGYFKISTNNSSGTSGGMTVSTLVGGSLGEAFRIDDNRRLLVGTSTARTNFFNTVFTTSIQAEGTNSQNASLGLISTGNNSFDTGLLVLAKGRGASNGANTIVQSGDITGLLSFQGNDGSEFVEAASIKAEVDGTPGANDMPGRLVFSTTADGASSPTERMRIGQNGSTSLFSSDNGHLARVSAGAGTGTAIYVGYHSATSTTTGTVSFQVFSNGNVQNTNNSYGAISDAKLKENIVDANSQWDDIKALQVRNYNFKEGQTHTQIGLVAQEVELVSPGLVTESLDRDEDGNDLGTTTKSVNYSVLYMKAVKALQEAMERIEVLEQRLTDAGIA